MARSAPAWLALLVTATSCSQLEHAPGHDKYERTKAGYLLVLRQGDDALAQLKDFAQREKLQGATFTGLGFGHATFGYFNRETKQYDPREFRDVELASLTGSIAWQDGAPSIHAHAVAGDRSFEAHAGHLLRFEVGSGSLEVYVVETGTALERKRDAAIGANVLTLGKP
jgi:predicted DNA-binding protein with PD1-like motif